MGMRPQPTSVIEKAKNPSAARHTTTMATASLARPKRATPTAYSTSVSGVAIRLSRFRDQVSSRKPVEAATWLWYRTWKRRIPASR